MLLYVKGSASPAGFPAMATDILLSPTGEFALAAVASQLYLINMSALPRESPRLMFTRLAMPTLKLTELGADHFSWADSKTLSWSAGNTLYLTTIESDTISELDARIQQPRQTPEGVVALRGARIITMNGDEVIRNGDILINANRIQAVGTSGTVEIPNTAAVFDLSGKTIMPGIIDIHAHWGVKRSVLDLEDYNAYANLAYGVTAIRDPQSLTDDIFVYADAVDTGKMVGPEFSPPVAAYFSLTTSNPMSRYTPFLNATSRNTEPT